MRAVILASQSPRRFALLRAAGFTVEVCVAAVDETPRRGEAPETLVARLAEAKARAAAQRLPAPRDGRVIVAADTTVALGPVVFNKPGSDAEAREMLLRLSGRRHVVRTGVAVLGHDVARVFVEETAVWFRTLGERDVDAYLATGEHRDKAGAYGIQGAAGVLVERVEGCLTNVIGLPIPALLRTLREAFPDDADADAEGVDPPPVPVSA